MSAPACPVLRGESLTRTPVSSVVGGMASCTIPDESDSMSGQKRSHEIWRRCAGCVRGQLTPAGEWRMTQWRGHRCRRTQQRSQATDQSFAETSHRKLAISEFYGPSARQTAGSGPQLLTQDQKRSVPAETGATACRTGDPSPFCLLRALQNDISRHGSEMPRRSNAEKIGSGSRQEAEGVAMPPAVGARAATVPSLLGPYKDAKCVHTKCAVRCPHIALVECALWDLTAKGGPLTRTVQDSAGQHLITMEAFNFPHDGVYALGEQKRVATLGLYLHKKL